MKLDIVEHLLVCLAEECAEVTQRVTKALRFGLDERQPGQDFTNTERIAIELRDLQVIIEELQAAVSPSACLEPLFDEAAHEEKRQKLLKFIAYAREQGTVTGYPAIQSV